MKKEPLTDWKSLPASIGYFLVSLWQYWAYCTISKLSHSMRPFECQMINGIDESTKSVGWAVIQVPFKYLNVVTDVVFFMVWNNILSLLLLKEMLDNRQNVSIQGQYVGFDKRSHPMAKGKIFSCSLIEPEKHIIYPRCKERAANTALVLGHSFVRTLHMLIEYTSGSRIAKIITDSMGMIR